jgi:hypothetical protein
MLCGLNAKLLIVRLRRWGAVVVGGVVGGLLRTVVATGGCVVGGVEGGRVAAATVDAADVRAAAAFGVELGDDFAVVVTPFAVVLVEPAPTAGFDRCDFDVVVL